MAYALERKLFDLGQTVVVLDGAAVRTGLSRELDFNPADRAEHLRRVAETAKIMNDHGLLVIAVFISPEAAIREQIAEIIGKDKFLEIYVKTTIDKCRENDKTGLYAKVEKGDIRYVPGIDIRYEEPLKPWFTAVTEKIAIPVVMENIINLLAAKEITEDE